MTVLQQFIDLCVLEGTDHYADLLTECVNQKYGPDLRSSAFAIVVGVMTTTVAINEDSRVALGTDSDEVGGVPTMLFSLTK